MKKLLIIFLLNTVNLSAHPHTFIDLHPNLHVEDGTIVKTEFKWKMDDMTSAMLIMEFDANNNGKIDKEESDFIYENYFLSLKSYNFYTEVEVDGKTMTLPKIKNFRATIEDNRICYFFELDESFSAKNTIFKFSDKEMFVAIMLKDKFIAIDGAKAKVDGEDMDFFFEHRISFE
ncbi:MAG: DUF1007 family protein [Sulfurospirillum sp.]|nr:DUF1007 family protein [Sulfurospirillum sp.]MBL0702689.1 DUF1007 family protein [Sulfurospirillum sp.]